MIVLDEDNRRRFSRNLMLPEVGEEGQSKLFGSKVLIVGCGALGSIAAMYLAGSGVGKVGLVDFDTVDISNLQRQLSFGVKDIGCKKTEVLAGRLKAISPEMEIEICDGLLSSKNVSEILTRFDLIVEGSDNPETKYIVSDSCCELGIPCVIGGIVGTVGQVMSYKPGHSGYRDFFSEGADSGSFTPCSLGGVLGPLPGIIGSIQAVETIKILTGFGNPLIDRLLLVDASSMTFTEVSC